MVLKKGSNGEDVRRLQIFLGIDNPNGNFGPITEARVKEWQTNQNLSPDGVLTDIMWDMIFPAETVVNQVSDTEFKLNQLRGFIPDTVLDQIPATATQFNISNNLRLAHFLSQCGHESGGFKAVVENLNYSAERLKVKFSKYFPNNDYEAYARNPVKTGCRVYGGRNGNGDEASGDGYKYRGRGYIQLTGKENYIKFAGFVGEDTVTNPDLVATKYPLSSAAFYFASRKIWPVCDRGSSEQVITSVTRLVNGGINGLPERIMFFNKFFNLLK